MALTKRSSLVMIRFSPSSRSTIIVLAAALMLSGLMGCRKTARVIDGHAGGAEWKDLTETERSTYVEGYLGGYGMGTFAACDITDRLFDAKGPPFLADGAINTASNQCIRALNRYDRAGLHGKERPDYTMYTDVMTELYTKYPKYDAVPIAWMLSLMYDKGYTSTDQLFQKLERHDMQWTY